jgi:hypothetical protein
LESKCEQVEQRAEQAEEESMTLSNAIQDLNEKCAKQKKIAEEWKEQRDKGSKENEDLKCKLDKSEQRAEQADEESMTLSNIMKDLNEKSARQKKIADEWKEQRDKGSKENEDLKCKLDKCEQRVKLANSNSEKSRKECAKQKEAADDHAIIFQALEKECDKQTKTNQAHVWGFKCGTFLLVVVTLAVWLYSGIPLEQGLYSADQGRVQPTRAGEAHADQNGQSDGCRCDVDATCANSEAVISTTASLIEVATTADWSPCGRGKARGDDGICIGVNSACDQSVREDSRESAIYRCQEQLIREQTGCFPPYLDCDPTILNKTRASHLGIVHSVILAFGENNNFALIHDRERASVPFPLVVEVVGDIFPESDTEISFGESAVGDHLATFSSLMDCLIHSDGLDHLLEMQVHYSDHRANIIKTDEGCDVVFGEGMPTLSTAQISALWVRHLWEKVNQDKQHSRPKSVELVVPDKLLEDKSDVKRTEFLAAVMGSGISLSAEAPTVRLISHSESYCHCAQIQLPNHGNRSIVLLEMKRFEVVASVLNCAAEFKVLDRRSFQAGQVQVHEAVGAYREGVDSYRFDVLMCLLCVGGVWYYTAQTTCD